MQSELLEKRLVRVGRIQKWIRLMLILPWLAASWAVSSSHAASFSAKLEPETVAVGDTAALKLVFEGSGQIQLSPLPNLPGLVVSGPEQGRSVSIVNGQQTETYSVTYYLRPTQTNAFNIPSLSARIGSEILRSEPLQLTAVKATQGAAGQALAVLRLIVPKERVYLGETLLVELQLMLRGNASNPTEFAMPDFSGSGWLAGQPMQAQKRQAQFGGQIVSIWPIQVPLTPLKAGKLTIGPMESSIVVQVPSQARRNDPFGGLGFGLFQSTQPRRVPLSLPAHEIEVLPLPRENVPESFSGAIGEFQMSVSAGPTNVTVGDPITLRVQISGQGNMASISLPTPLVKGDFKTYEPEMKLESTDDFGLEGLKTVEQIIIPQNTEVREVPPIEFSYFDTALGTYRTLRQPAIPLEVRPAGSRPAPVVAAGTELGQTGAPRQDIVHIKQRMGSLKKGLAARSPIKQLLAWNIIPLLGWMGVVVWHRRKEALGRDPQRQREQQVRRVVSRGFIDLKEFSETGKSEEFFATVFRMLQEQLGLMLDQPSSGITESAVDEKLRAMGIKETTLATLHELFQACNIARYAPTRDRQELTALLPKLEGALRELEDAR